MQRLQGWLVRLLVWALTVAALLPTTIIYLSGTFLFLVLVLPGGEWPKADQWRLIGLMAIWGYGLASLWWLGLRLFAAVERGIPWKVRIGLASGFVGALPFWLFSVVGGWSEIESPGELLDWARLNLALGIGPLVLLLTLLALIGLERKGLLPSLLGRPYRAGQASTASERGSA